ncbi:unnamed protein product [Ophioblennius macclurei]
MIRPLLMCYVLCVVSASSKPTKKDRVHHEEPLSKLEHNDQENYDYDHEAFLGHDEADAFAELSPEESKRRLSIIVSKIDSDRSAYVTEEELKSWMVHIQKKHIFENVAKQFQHFDKNEDKFVTWAEYKDFTFSNFLNDPKGPSSHDAQLMAKDERRFKAADQNGDKRIDKEELTAFLHPEEFAHMKDIVVKEIIEDMDKDNDGFVNMTEYIGDMYSPEQGEEEPEWIAEERQLFLEKRDQNKDGKLDQTEVLHWILPDDDYALLEAQHLMHEADADQDGKLTEEEILEKYAVFVGSQVTNFGEALHHDEF